VTISVANLNQAEIFISPSLTGSGLPYDIELVWGGNGGGNSAYFNYLQSNLAIFYEVKPNLYSPFPVVYNYGFDTQESASDLQSYIGTNGLVCVRYTKPYLVN